MKLSEVENRVSSMLRGVLDPDEKNYLVKQVDSFLSQLKNQLLTVKVKPDASIAQDLVALACRVSSLYSELGCWDRAVEALGVVEELYKSGHRLIRMAEAMKERGKLYRSKAMWDHAIRCYEIGLEIYKACGSNEGVADMHNSIGIANFERGSWDDAEKHYHKALELTEDKSASLRAKIHNNLGALYNARGQTELAISSYLRSIPDFEQTGNELGLAQAYHNLGMSFADKGDWETAASYYDKSLEISRRLSENELTALTLSLIHI